MFLFHSTLFLFVQSRDFLSCILCSVFICCCFFFISEILWLLICFFSHSVLWTILFPIRANLCFKTLLICFLVRSVLINFMLVLRNGDRPHSSLFLQKCFWFFANILRFELCCNFFLRKFQLYLLFFFVFIVFDNYKKLAQNLRLFLLQCFIEYFIQSGIYMLFKENFFRA